MKWLLRYFFRGLLVMMPAAATFLVLWWIFDRLDSYVFAPLGARIAGEAAQVPGILVTALGLVATVALVTLAGLLASNVAGRAIVARLEGLLSDLPLVRLLYGSIKDLLGAFVGEKKGFDRPVLVRLGAEQGGAKVMGFVTSESLDFLGIAGHVAVYLPQSYNFAGNLLLVPAEFVEAVPAGSADVMTFLVSGGVAGLHDAPARPVPEKVR